MYNSPLGNITTGYTEAQILALVPSSYTNQAFLARNTGITYTSNGTTWVNANSGISGVLNNYTLGRIPTLTDNASAGFSVGSQASAVSGADVYTLTKFNGTNAQWTLINKDNTFNDKIAFEGATGLNLPTGNIALAGQTVFILNANGMVSTGVNTGSGSLIIDGSSAYYLVDSSGLTYTFISSLNNGTPTVDQFLRNSTAKALLPVGTYITEIAFTDGMPTGCNPNDIIRKTGASTYQIVSTYANYTKASIQVGTGTSAYLLQKNGIGGWFSSIGIGIGVSSKNDGNLYGVVNGTNNNGDFSLGLTGYSTKLLAVNGYAPSSPISSSASTVLTLAVTTMPDGSAGMLVTSAGVVPVGTSIIFPTVLVQGQFQRQLKLDIYNQIILGILARGIYTTDNLSVFGYDYTNNRIINIDGGIAQLFNQTNINKAGGMPTGAITIPDNCSSFGLIVMFTVASVGAVNFKIGKTILADKSTSGASQNFAIVGSLLEHSSKTSPKGYLYCNGSAISRTQYSELFQVVGVSYGAGDGLTTFNLPDLRGRFIRGMNDGTGNDPNASIRTALNTGGNIGDNIGSYQADQVGPAFADSSDSAGGGSRVSFGGSSNGTKTISSSNGTETRPKNVNVAYHICYTNGGITSGLISQNTNYATSWKTSAIYYYAFVGYASGQSGQALALLFDVMTSKSNPSNIYDPSTGNITIQASDDYDIQGSANIYPGSKGNPPASCEIRISVYVVTSTTPNLVSGSYIDMVTGTAQANSNAGVTGVLNNFYFVAGTVLRIAPFSQNGYYLQAGARFSIKRSNQNVVAIGSSLSDIELLSTNSPTVTTANVPSSGNIVICNIAKITGAALSYNITTGYGTVLQMGKYLFTGYVEINQNSSDYALYICVIKQGVAVNYFVNHEAQNYAVNINQSTSISIAIRLYQGDTFSIQARPGGANSMVSTNTHVEVTRLGD